jgi:hypothetical protein
VVTRDVDGKLVINKPKKVVNPYLYGDRNHVEKFQECSNFRKLRYDGNGQQHVHLERDMEVSRIRSKKVEKAEHRRRISLHGTVKWATQGVQRKTFLDLQDKMPKAVENKH